MERKYGQKNKEETELGRLVYKIVMTQVPDTIGRGGQQALSILNTKANKKK